MACRPVFQTLLTRDIFKTSNVSFTYYNGYSIIQKQKSIKSLHDAFKESNKEARILEISTKSDNPLGLKLSAFNLVLKDKLNRLLCVESVFQSCKVFERGGPYTDIRLLSAFEARRDNRLKTSGSFVGFCLNSKTMPTEPRTLFYNWLYINTLNQPHNANIAEQVLEYSSFTDIEFNPKIQFNCQAEATAIFVSLKKQGLLTRALESINSFSEIVYKKNTDSDKTDFEKQLTFDFSFNKKER